MKSLLFKILAEWAGPLLGRRQLIRAGRFVTRAGTLDYPNSLGVNGERLVQLAAIGSSGKTVTVVDCGANLGQWALSLLETFGSAGGGKRLDLTCFEPSSFTHEKLVGTLAARTTDTVTARAERAALSAHDGEAVLAVVHDGAGVNSLVEVPGTAAKHETVACMTLAYYAAAHAIDQIDLLKIDAEGHDYSVMLGAEPLLASQRIRMIQFEYNWRWIYARHFLRDAFELLGNHGYELFKVTPLGMLPLGSYTTDYEAYVEGNYLACRSEDAMQLPRVKPWRTS